MAHHFLIMKTITIQVTAEDIRKGRRNISKSCPIALAINRQLEITVEVGGYFIFMGSSRYPLSDLVFGFVGNFDLYGPESVKPFSFELTLPAEILK